MKHYNQGLYPNFETWLNSTQQFVIADLWTFFTLAPYWNETFGLQRGQTVYQWTSWDRDVVLRDEYGTPTDTYVATGPLIERSRVRTVIGVEVDRMHITVRANESMLINGRPFLQAAVRGDLDGARVVLDRAFMDETFTVQGVLNMFSGRLAPAKISRSTAEFEISSDLELLNVNMPRNLYQPGCQNTLYDFNCKVNQAEVATAGAVLDSPTTTSFGASTVNVVPSGYLSLGGLIFTSGALEGVVATIKSYNGTSITLVNALPFAPNVNDQFMAWPGCNKTQSTCTSKFNNVDNFKGFPYVPVPETMG